ncbi:MAG: hypothetical protein K9K63_00815 [Desulfotignum sp.]|nr:hypothetical protein [Desulfotignum sp.]MCF8135834.1 hypothetical protein [Desulfotignum sp.]
MMDRVWLFDPPSKTPTRESRIWELISDRLINEGYWEKVFRRVYKPTFEELARLKKNCKIPDNQKFNKNQIYDTLIKDRYPIMDMLYRKTDWGTNRYNSTSFHELSNRIWLYFEFSFLFLIKERITLVVYWNPPHMGWNYIACQVAKSLGIKTLILDQAKFINKFFHYFDFHDHGAFLTSKKLAYTTRFKIEKKIEKEWFYMKKNRGVKSQLSFKKLLTPSRYKKRLNLIIENNDYLRLFRELCIRERRPQAFFRFYTERNYQRALKNAYSRNVSLDSKYVYFPLHKQPERSTSIWGGIYLDQMLAIERLSELIPGNWHIYVKENPKQTGAYRDTLFFQRMKLIPNLSLLPKESNTHELIRYSQFVATILGTAGWEAITGGKNVLIFGWGTWYKNLPGVYHYHPDIDIQELAEARIDHHELEKKVAEIFNKCGTGLVNFRQIPSIPNFDVESNTDMVVKSLKQILYDK